MSDRNKNIDELILSSATEDWQKTAMLISKIFDNPKFDKTYSAQDIATRIQIIVDSGKLMSKGNMRRWRDSSVRLACLVSL